MIKQGKLIIGFFWGDNKKKIIEAATWSVDLLEELQNSFPVFKELYITSSEEKLDLSNNSRSGSINILANEILRLKIPAIKKYHKGVEPSINFKEEVGHTFSLHTSGDVLKQFVLSFSIGAYAKGLTNRLIVNYPIDFHISYEWAYLFFNKLNKFIQPKYSFIASNRVMNKQNLPEFFFGWMNYFDNSIQLPPMPNNYIIEETDKIGTLLITTKEDFDAVNNPTHYDKARQLVELFRSHNIVRP